MWEIEMRWGSLLKICSLTIGAFVMVVLVQAMISNTAARDGNINWPTIATSQYASGLDLPVHITHANDGSGRMFVVEKPGRIQIIRGGSVETTPFLDITDRVLSAGNEQGLLSVAFPPTYTEKGYFYVDYTDLNGDTVIARYHVTADPDVAEAGSEEIILRIPQPYENHNGGQLAFGPDGYLYIGMGDGGSGGDPHDYAQDPGSLLGKILRIDVELSRTTVSSALPITIYLPLVSKSGGLPYRIPPSNPFTETTGYRDEIWALGLRNPWRFSFDSSTNDLYIGDVGQGSYEEIDFQAASSVGGENYGWNIMEGTHCYASTTCDTTGLVLPVVEYDHSLGCSVTGGLAYRGTITSMQGVYFYGDYCSGRIWGLTYDGNSWSNTLLLNSDYTIASFGTDEEERLYLADYWNGRIFEIVEAP